MQIAQTGIIKTLTQLQISLLANFVLIHVKLVNGTHLPALLATPTTSISKVLAIQLATNPDIFPILSLGNAYPVTPNVSNLILI
jgi:hypothetical protein